MGAIILLAVSVSFDSMGTGMAYAMRGVRIPWSTRLLTALSGGILTLLAVTAGDWMKKWIPDLAFTLIGGSILIILGIHAAADVIKNIPGKDYDRDGSKVLEPCESAALCLSMAVDSMSAGLCLGNEGWQKLLFPLFTALSGILFLSAGNCIRARSCLPGIFGGLLLMALGAFRLLACF